MSSYQFDKIKRKMKREMVNEYGYMFCENCGINNSPFWEVHHLAYRSEIPGHPEVHNKRNLLIVCSHCHQGFHKDKDSRIPWIVKRKLWELFDHLQKYNPNPEWKT